MIRHLFILFILLTSESSASAEEVLATLYDLNHKKIAEVWLDLRLEEKDPHSDMYKGVWTGRASAGSMLNQSTPIELRHASGPLNRLSNPLNGHEGVVIYLHPNNIFGSSINLYWYRKDSPKKGEWSGETDTGTASTGTFEVK